MLYQLEFVPFLLVFSFDLAAFFLLFRLVRVPEQFVQITAYATALLFALGTTLLKLMCSIPDFAASTPGDLFIENTTGNWFQSFYYLHENDMGQLSALWQEHTFGRRKTQTLEMEGMTNLLVTKKIDGQWRYQRVLPARKTSRPMVLDLADARFRPDPSGRIARAVHVYQLMEVGNYLSELLTLAVLFLLIRRLPTLRRCFGPTRAAIVAVT